MFHELLAHIRMFAEKLIHIFIAEASAALKSLLTDAASDELGNDVLRWAIASHKITELDLGEHSEVAGLVRIDSFGFCEEGLELLDLGKEVGGCFFFRAELLFGDVGFGFDERGHGVAGCEEALLSFGEGGEQGD